MPEIGAGQALLDRFLKKVVVWHTPFRFVVMAEMGAFFHAASRYHSGLILLVGRD